jgi:hypothetical protein
MNDFKEDSSYSITENAQNSGGLLSKDVKVKGQRRKLKLLRH